MLEVEIDGVLVRVRLELGTIGNERGDADGDGDGLPPKHSCKNASYSEANSVRPPVTVASKMHACE